MNAVRAFGAFLYDFLVGDRPELFVGPIVALAVVALLVAAGVPSLGAGVLLAGLIIATAGFSLGLVLRRP